MSKRLLKVDNHSKELSGNLIVVETEREQLKRKLDSAYAVAAKERQRMEELSKLLSATQADQVDMQKELS